MLPSNCTEHKVTYLDTVISFGADFNVQLYRFKGTRHRFSILNSSSLNLDELIGPSVRALSRSRERRYFASM